MPVTSGDLYSVELKLSSFTTLLGRTRRCCIHYTRAIGLSDFDRSTEVRVEAFYGSVQDLNTPSIAQREDLASGYTLGGHGEEFLMPMVTGYSLSSGTKTRNVQGQDLTRRYALEESLTQSFTAKSIACSTAEHPADSHSISVP
jgi:hypothetical protein